MSTHTILYIYRVHILKYDAVAHFSTCNVCDANQKGSSENQKTSFSKQISFSKQWKGSSEDVEGLTSMHVFRKPNDEVIGVSLREPHTSVTLLRTYVSMLACLLAWTDHLPEIFK